MRSIKSEMKQKLPRNILLSDDVRQIVKIVQEQFQAADVITDQHQYVKRFRSHFDAAYPELRFLRLAEADENSPFDWSPTPLLSNLIAERGSAEKETPLYEADI